MSDSTKYQVLARKYRPRNFDDLIGHDVMVQTLQNAFDADRIAQAWILSGVRGIGKTTTARILARALNYETDDIDRPTIHMAEDGKHCQAIAEDRHPDVMEMDAASRTGVDNIRELIDSVRYAPTQARYKVYIIDEVHMLSKNAFNALLKTLEEPPEHVKFIFATTEINQIPITVLSRCQRFDLKRFDVDMLTAHLQTICEKEKRNVAKAGLEMIARAAEGSVRDALSLLDQALIQHTDEDDIAAELIQKMLSLADRQSSWALLKSCLAGTTEDALSQFRGQYDSGINPEYMVKELLSLVHLCTRTKAAGADSANYGAAGEADAPIVTELCAQYSLAAFSKLWSMLLKTLADIKDAPDHAAAAEMGLIRICYAADLPSPAEAVAILKKKLNEAWPPQEKKAQKTKAQDKQTQGTVSDAKQPIAKPQAVAASNAPAATPAPATPKPQDQTFPDFQSLIQLVASKREMRLVSAMERFMRVTHFETGRIDFIPAQDCPKELGNVLAKKLHEWTMRRWVVNQKSTTAQNNNPFDQKVKTIKSEREEKVMSHPMVAQAKSVFPDAEFVIRKMEQIAQIPDNGEK